MAQQNKTAHTPRPKNSHSKGSYIRFCLSCMRLVPSVRSRHSICTSSSCQHLSDSLAPLGQFRGTERTQPLLHLWYQTSCSLAPSPGLLLTDCTPITSHAPARATAKLPKILSPFEAYRGQKVHLFPPHEKPCPSALLTTAP